MGTPAFIGIQSTEDGPITGIYCHNGHFESLAVMLYENYRTLEQVKELINLGSLSSVGKTITNPRTHAYIRDMGFSFHKNIAKIFQNLREVKAKTNGDFYAYFIFSVNKWYTSERGHYLTSLSNALLQMDLLTPVTTECKCESCQG